MVNIILYKFFEVGLMKSKLIYIFLFVFVNSYFLFAQTTYYVSSSVGNDSNSGTSENAPLKTIQKINSLSLKPGDKVLFKRGDSWTGTGIKINNVKGTQNNRIVFGAYGNGEKPIISLLVEIQNWKDINRWSKVDNNKWKIELSGKQKSNRINRLWLDGVEYKKAETKDIYWATTSHYGIPLKPGPRYTYGISDEYRFWDDGNGTLYVFSPENPATYYSSMKTNISETSIYVVHIKNSDFVTLTDLDLRGGLRTVRIEGGYAIIVENSIIGYSSMQGISLRNNYDTKMSEYCIIRNNFMDSHYSELYGGIYRWLGGAYTVEGNSFISVNIGVSLENGVNYTKVYNNYVKDYHFASFRIHGGDNKYKKSTYNEIFDNKSFTENVVSGRLGHIGAYAPQIGACSYNKFYRNYAKSTGLTFEIGGDHNYVFYNIVDESHYVEPKVYTGMGNGISLEPTNPDGISKFNYVFNNTIYNVVKRPLGRWPQKDCQLFNNLIINSGTGVDNIWLGENPNKGTIVKNNLIYFPGKNKNDIVCQFAGKGLTIDEFNKIDENYNEEFSGNILFTGNLKDLIADPANGDFTVVKGSPADGGGIDISKLVPAGFVDINGNTVNLSKPSIGAVEASETVPQRTTVSNIKVFLEGAYIGGSMDSKLARNKVIPKTQPYNNTPWNYNGNETVSGIRNDIVDWILLELRSDENMVKHREAALLNRNGYVVGLDGSSNFKFKDIDEGDYYLVIYHRNHLPVMSARKIHVAQNGAAEYNFTQDAANIYGGKNAVADFNDGYFGLLAGDSDANGVINVLDNGAVQTNMFTLGYTSSDTDMNNIVNVLDYTFVSKNLLKTTKVP